MAAFEQAFLYAFVMVTAIIWLVLRDAKDTLLVIAPDVRRATQLVKRLEHLAGEGGPT